MQMYISYTELSNLSGFTNSQVGEFCRAFELKMSGKKVHVDETIFFSMLRFLHDKKGFTKPHLRLFTKKQVINIYRALK